MATSQRSNKFFSDLPNLSIAYKDSDFKLTSPAVNLKMIIEGTGTLEYSLNGPDNNKVDGAIEAADGFVTFEDMDFHRLSFRKVGTVSAARIWAWG